MTDSIRVFDPGFRVLDTSGNPVSGAKIKFYNAGGLVARTVYSDSGLSVSLGVTVTCDSGGVPAASAGAGADVLIYTGTTAYKVIITDSLDATIFEFDNILGALDTSSFGTATALPKTPVLVKSSDYTIVTGDRASVINADPTGATVTLTLPSAITVGDNWRITARHNGTANTVVLQTVSAQTINGATSLTLYYQYEGVTLVSDGANWHVSEDGYMRYPAGTVTPQGRLTLTSATPILAADVTAAAAVYYTPYVGNLVPLYSGTRFVPYEFSELTLSLVSNHTAGNIYDVFAFLDGSTLRIGTGPTWSTLTAGAGARGTGAGTTQLTRTNGLWINTVSMTVRNGGNTYSVAASRATYLGTIFMDGTNGQVSCHVTVGQARKWAVWNAFNRVSIVMLASDPTASWNYSTNTTRASNGESNNKITTMFGLAEEYVDIEFRQKVTQASNNSSVSLGIGINSTTTESGYFPTINISATGGVQARDMLAKLCDVPKLGVNAYQMLETAVGAAVTTTWNGTEENMLMTARFRA